MVIVFSIAFIIQISICIHLVYLGIGMQYIFIPQIQFMMLPNASYISKNQHQNSLQFFVAVINTYVSS